MSESFSVRIRVVSRLYREKPPVGRYLWGASLCPLGCPLLFFGLGKEKKQKNLHSHRLDARIERALSSPSLRSVVAPMGALLYASRWRTHARSIGRLWGGEAPQSRGYPSTPPESSPRGAFFCGRKPPLPPKKPLRISPQLITLW